VVFRRRNMSLRPVHSIKHVVDIQGGSVGGVNTANNLINTVDAPVLANTANVETGCRVNSVYLKVEAYATTGVGLANAYMIVMKNPGGNLAAVVPNAVGSNDNKRFVIHQEMVMLQEVADGNPRTLFQGVISIPRGYKRFGINDLLQIFILSPAVTINFCIQCIFKEYR